VLSAGADQIDRKTFEDTMSIIVKHRSDMDLVAERVGVKLDKPGSAALSGPRPA